jgi:hypothetical protein
MEKCQAVANKNKRPALKKRCRGEGLYAVFDIERGAPEMHLASKLRLRDSISGEIQNRCCFSKLQEWRIK